MFDGCNFEVTSICKYCGKKLKYSTIFCCDKCERKYWSWKKKNKKYIAGLSENGVLIKLNKDTQIEIPYVKKYKKVKRFIQDYKKKLSQSKKNITIKKFVRGVLKFKEDDC